MENLPAKIDSKVVEDFLFSTSTKLQDEHKKLFIALAVRNNLDPFKREIYAVPYEVDGKVQLSVVTGYEVYLKRAERSSKLDGWKCWTEGEGDKLKAVIEIKRKDWSQPLKHEVLFKEYNLGYKIWRTKPQTMIKKVVIAQGFRLAFPEEVGGMPYTSDEIESHEATEEDMEAFKKESEKKFAEYHDRMMKIDNAFELKNYYKKHFHEMQDALMPEHFTLIEKLKDKLKVKLGEVK